MGGRVSSWSSNSIARVCWKVGHMLLDIGHIHTHARTSNSPHRSISSPCSLAHGRTIILRGPRSASCCLSGWKGRWDTHTHTHRSPLCCWAGLKGRWVHCVIMAAGLRVVGTGHFDFERTHWVRCTETELNLVYYIGSIHFESVFISAGYIQDLYLSLWMSYNSCVFLCSMSVSLGHCESFSSKAINGKKWFWIRAGSLWDKKIRWIVLSIWHHVLVCSKSTWSISWASQKVILIEQQK